MTTVDKELRERLEKLHADVMQLGKDFEIEYNKGMSERRSPVVDDPRDSANNEASVFCFTAVDLLRRAKEALNVIK